MNLHQFETKEDRKLRLRHDAAERSRERKRLKAEQAEKEEFETSLGF